MLAALLLAGQAFAHGAPAYEPGYEPRRCECARVERVHEEVRLDDSFFVGAGGVGPAYSPPVHGGGGMVVVVGGGGSGFAGASASASASASVRANVSVSIAGGWHGGGGHGGKPHGGGYGGKH